MIINKTRSTQHAIPPVVLGSDTIQICSKVKNLRMIFDQLNWTDHVAYIRNNAMYFLRRPWSIRKILVTSLIVPKLLYCDVTFSKASCGISEELKHILNSCARYISLLPCNIGVLPKNLFRDNRFFRFFTKNIGSNEIIFTRKVSEHDNAMLLIQISAMLDHLS
jgi:hypothetical protein